jgi:hypothetical protein
MICRNYQQHTLNSTALKITAASTYYNNFRLLLIYNFISAFTNSVIKSRSKTAQFTIGLVFPTEPRWLSQYGD